MNGQRTSLLRSVAGFALLALVGVRASEPAVVADEPLRVWLDRTGQHAVRAKLQEQRDGRVILARPDGTQLSIQISQLSRTDQAYLSGHALPLGTLNPLRTAEVSLPPLEPQPLLDLPAAATVLDDGSVISLATKRLTAAPTESLGPLPPDPATETFQVSTGRIPLTEAEANGSQSRVIPIRLGGKDRLVMSVSQQFSLSSAGAANRLLVFDMDEVKSVAAWKGRDSIRLLDHHHARERSLVLVGHTTLGNGGRLAIAEGWNAGNVILAHERALPPSAGIGRGPSVHWARWIDEEHVVALVDRSLFAWNLLSGERLFQIDELDDEAIPAISYGRRYLAVPSRQAVDVYRTTDGAPLGRLELKADTAPNVCFGPRGDSLVIATQQRLVVWTLSAASIRSDVKSRRLGKSRPVWVSDDLLLTSNGTLVSVSRGVPVWRYDLTGAEVTWAGNCTAVLRQHPTAELVTLRVPHTTARRALRQVASNPQVKSSRQSGSQLAMPQPMGRSDWLDGTWVDRDDSR